MHNEKHTVFSQSEKISEPAAREDEEVDEGKRKEGRQPGILNMQMNRRYNRASMKTKRWHAMRYANPFVRVCSLLPSFGFAIILTYTDIYLIDDIFAIDLLEKIHREFRLRYGTFE